MENYVSRMEVREINKKLFAFDIKYSNKDSKTAIDLIISSIIQNYKAEDEVSGVPTILRLTPENIQEDSLDKIKLLSLGSVIVEVNNKSLNDSNCLEIIKQLSEIGYKIMVEINSDDIYFNYAKIVADIVKIDISTVNISNNGLVEFQCKKLAYNVDKSDDYVLAESANIDYYEGEYIATSVDLDIRQNGHSKVNFLELVRVLNETNDLNKATRIISRDPLLSAQVIRLSNSKYYSTSSKIVEVAEATSRIGIENLKRWVILLQYSRVDSVPEGIIQESYQRAELAKMIVNTFKVKGITEAQAYMIGLFSEINILTGRSFNEELVTLNIDSVVEDALIYRDGIGGKILNLIIAYEEANWKRIEMYCSELKVSKDKLFKVYYKSINEVANIWTNLTKYGGII